MKYSKALTILALVFALCGTATRAVAQDKPVVNYITQAAQKMVIPDGSTEDDMWKVMQEYYDEVLSKSAILKHYSVYRHAWGTMGATVVTTLDFATWEDINKFNSVVREALEKTTRPDETARKAFLKKMSSFEDPYHRHEIYTISNTMRK